MIDPVEFRAYIKQYKEDHPGEPPDSWMAAVPVVEGKEPHVSSNLTCAVVHSDGQGPCIKCARCGKWIRPMNMSLRCGC